MTQLILTLPNEQDVDWLVPMLARLGVQSKPVEKAISAEERAMHMAVIEAGGDDRDNIDAYIAEFEQSRKDRTLPFRE